MGQTSFDALLTAPAKAPVRPAEPELKPLSVTQLNDKAARMLEGQLGQVFVLGEISGFKPHQSGHWYFNLKDDGAQISACCFKGSQRTMTFRPRDGQQVIARGKVTVYGARGAYQMVIDQLQPAGAGALQQKFEELKARLAAEGLFAQERKREVPRLARRIGVITSPDGAAVRDFIRIATQRHPGVSVVIFPARVQGAGAAEEVARMIDYACRRAPELGLDVLVVTRGGGSLEDLWAFNEEVVVRALARATVPTVSAIGHEVDVTLSDFVCDARSPTPSAAAQLTVFDAAALRRGFAEHARALERTLRYRAEKLRGRLSRIHAAFRDPSHRLHRHRQRLDDLSSRIEDALRERVVELRQRVHGAQITLGQNHPRHRLQRDQERLDRVRDAIARLTQEHVRRREERLARAAGTLHALSPLAVLSRGYSVVMHADQAVRRAGEVGVGDEVKILLHQGELLAVIKDIT